MTAPSIGNSVSIKSYLTIDDKTNMCPSLMIYAIPLRASKSKVELHLLTYSQHHNKSKDVFGSGNSTLSGQ